MSGCRAARSLTLSSAELARHLANPFPTPLILPHLAADWPARRSWTLSDGLMRLRSGIGEDRAVEVELGPRGRGYLDGRYRRVSMGFGLFLDAFILGRIPSSTPKPQQPVGYLAQHDIPLPPRPDLLTSSTSSPLSGSHSDIFLQTSNDLLDDLPYTACVETGPRKEFWRRTLWIGPEGTFTPFHKDPYIGIYTQLIGRKRFHLVPPSAAEHLAISARAPHTNTSTIPVSVSTVAAWAETDVEGGTNDPAQVATDQDLSDLPQQSISQYAEMLRSAFAAEGACSAELGPGQSVLIPEGWYHSAEGLEVGVGVNAWFR